MAIISSGYEGTVNEAQWADLIAFAGGRQYAVADAASWAVTLGAADREVRIAVGRGFGYGVRDLSDTVVSITIPAATTGSRYDLIVAHRDWQANTTTFTRIPGTSARELPARAQTPGTVDDQPVALVRVTAGQAQVTEIIDLRVWGGDGGAYARDELVLQFLNRLGTRIRIGNTEFFRGLDSLSIPAWFRTAVTPDTGWVNVPANDASWSNAGAFGYRGLAVRRVGSQVIIEGTLIRNAEVLSGYVGAIVPAGFRPSARVLVPSQRDALEVSANPDGAVMLTGQTLPANTPITVSGSWFVD